MGDNGTKQLAGRIYSSGPAEYYQLNSIMIILRSNNIAFDTIITNERGEFRATIPPEKQRKVDLIYSGIGFGTVYLKYFKELTADTTNVQIDVAGQYKKNIFGIAYCPRCRKSNQVYKIRYGDAPVFTSTINNNGDTVYSPIHNGIYEARTCISTTQSAQWYCDRDKIEF